MLRSGLGPVGQEDVGAGRDALGEHSRVVLPLTEQRDDPGAVAADDLHLHTVLVLGDVLAADLGELTGQQPSAETERGYRPHGVTLVRGRLTTGPHLDGAHLLGTVGLGGRVATDALQLHHTLVGRQHVVGEPEQTRPDGAPATRGRGPPARSSRSS